MLPESIRKTIEEYGKARKLKKKEIEEMIKKAEQWWEEHSAQAGDGVGVLAAQSLGEPTTQATLRVFHYAGAAEVTVASGISRAVEIVDLLANLKYPIMIVPLRKKYIKTEEEARRFAKSLEEVKVGDLVEIEEDLAKRKVKVRINTLKCEEHGIKEEAVLKKIETKFKVKGKKGKNGYEFVFPKEKPLSKIRLAVETLKAQHIGGIKGIRHAIVKRSGDQWVVWTSGTNLKAVMKLKEVEWERVYSNDIREVEKVLGIEAARRVIIQELITAYEKMYVDPRHFTLVADAMTKEGKLMAIGRSGVAGAKGSVLARAAFEETGKHLVHAAIYNERDELKGVSENIIVGLPVKLGTGIVKLGVK